MLGTGLYHVQVVGKVQDKASVKSSAEMSNEDVEMTNGESSKPADARVRWHLEFKDTPDPGKQTLSTRFIARVPIEDGNVMHFMEQFGFQ